MKQTQFTLKRMLLLPLALVAAVLLLSLRGPKEGADRSQGSREEAEESVQELSEELEPQANDQELPGSIPPREHQRLVTETALADRLTESDAAKRDGDQGDTATADAYVGAASFRCIVPDGGAMLTGGWPVPNDGYVFALISPKPTPGSDGHAVTVSALLFELPAEQVTAPEWNTWLGSPQERLNFRGASLNANEVAAFREAHASNMTRIMSSPSVSMPEGRYASMQVTGSSGGVMLGIIAERAADGSGIEVAVSVAEHKGLNDADDTENRN